MRDIAFKRVAPAIVEDTNSEMVAFFSNSLQRAREMCDRFGAPRAYDRLEDLLADEAVQAIYIASPQSRHHAETLAAAAAKKHVLCEKPLACDVKQCREMIDACRDNSVNLAAAYYRRWYPKARLMKQIIDDGRIGIPVRARILIGGRYDPTPNDWKYWRVQADAVGGAMMDVGSHRLDIITGHLAMDYAVPDTETLLCRMENGVHLECAAQWNLPRGHDEMEIHGTAGSLVATPFDGDTLVLRSAEGEECFTGLAPEGNVHLPLIASFAQRTLAGMPPEFDGEDGMQASRIMDAAYRSEKSRAWEQT